MKRKKYILIAILVFFISNAAEVELFSSDDDIEFKGRGLDGLTIKHDKTSKSPTPVENQEDLFKLVPEIREWMREEKFVGVENQKKLFEELVEVLKQSWERTIDEILNDNRLEKSLKEKIKKNLDRDELKMQFEFPLKDPNTGAYADGSLGDHCLRIQGNAGGKFLRQVIHFICDHLKNNGAE